MADPGGFDPYNDPNERSFGLPDNLFDILNAPNNNSFGDLSLITEPFMHHSTSSSSVPQSNANIGGSSSSVPQSSSVPHSNVNIEDEDDPIYDPIVSEALKMINRANSEAGPLQARPETDNNQGNMRELVVWPVPPVPFLCSCCLVLREIIHSNGIVCTKLEIHGRLGMICHAILEIRQSTNSSQYHIFDFCNKSLEDVKNFLVQYCEERNQTGFYLLRDPLSIFYEALCVGLNFNENVIRNDYTQPNVTTQPNVATNEYTQPPVATNSGANAMNQAEVENVPDRRRNHPSLSVQTKWRRFKFSAANTTANNTSSLAYKFLLGMAHLGAFITYNDPNDNEIFNLLNHPNIFFDDLSLNEEPFMHHSTSSSSVPQSNVNIKDIDDPIFDPILWDTFNWLNGANSEAGPSQNYAETSNQARLETDNNHGNMRPVVVWPPVPFLCSCCLVLREIIHSNGYVCTKLDIHGRFGMICHAIQQSTNASWYQMFDFDKKNLKDVKNFLVQHCEEQKQAGFFLMPDPLSNFYGAVCVGLDFDDNVTTNNYTQPNPATDDYTQPSVATNSGVAQRDRSAKLTLQDLSQFFHLPIDKASRMLRLCPTVVKNACRRFGVDRWPYRKINSIHNQITRLSAKLCSIHPEEKAYAQAEIQRLQDQIAFIMSSGGSLDD
ncbi:hypothetical protein LWI28_011287 [Acer negundo]|uniref:RWP-RK domain-containing protein n=1 Tax=Acer negundo TaxID=4023 RepID=A0AAD5NXT2_ACENE|nr:hypothetical protein LWI28_011287 [Acer negundo]